jgi:hypothetical protein
MTTMPTFLLTRMSWPEVRSALKTVRLAIIPTGSCEQHGPNMTLETDAVLCSAPAERLAQCLYPRALLDRCSLGLVAAVFTRSLKNAFYFAERLRTGIVNVNAHSNYWESHLPFGGVSGTRSGIGRIGGNHSLTEMTDLRTMCIQVSR